MAQTRQPPSTAPTDPAASMALLRMLAEEAAHSEYDDAAERHPERVAHKGLRASVGAAVVVALVGLVLGAAVSQVRASAPATTAEKKALVVRITKGQANVAKLTKQKVALTAQVEVIRKAALANSVLGQRLEMYLGQVQIAAGYTDVSGPGASVTMANPDPNKPLPNGVDPNQAQVLDSDVQLVVNGLWMQGATAISINGIRLTSTTAIRSAGGSILVSYRPVLSPYVISAIGPKTLAAKFTSSSAGKQIDQVANSYGITVAVNAEASLHLTASTAVLPDVDNLKVTLPLPSNAAGKAAQTGGSQ
jgi:uncharacterized protein YlxW (UPF0749 family)